MTSWKEKALAYIVAKKDEKQANDIASSLNKEIKAYLDKKKGDKTIDCDGGAGVFLTYRSKDVWDEEKMIEYLESIGKADGIVKTKKYVDFEAFESVLYNESLPKKVLKELSKFKKEVKTAVLNIKATKGE